MRNAEASKCLIFGTFRAFWILGLRASHLVRRGPRNLPFGREIRRRLPSKPGFRMAAFRVITNGRIGFIGDRCSAGLYEEFGVYQTGEGHKT